jgi:hypothetical protein
MHSFDNSNNTKRKENNWYMLSKVFKDHPKLFPFQSQDYSDIKNNNFEQVVSFMKQLYMALAERR